MSGILTEIIQACRQVDPMADHEFVLDIVWQAACQGGLLTPATDSAEEPDQQSSQSRSAQFEEMQDAPRSDELHSRKEAPRPEKDRSSRIETPAGTAVHLPTRSGSSAGIPLRAPAPPVFSEQRALVRALRPLLRRVPSSRAFWLDTTATARVSAEESRFTPVLAPTPGPWLSLSIVLDVGETAGLWEETVRGFERLAVGTGRFRQVASGFLDASAPQLRLRRGTPCRVMGGATRRLLPEDGRHLLILLSDVRGRHWEDGRAAQWLAERRGEPVVLIHLLPARMWERTALTAGTPSWLPGCGPLTPAAAAVSLRPAVLQSDLHTGAGAEYSIPVPVASLEINRLSALCRWLAGGESCCYARLFDTRPAPWLPIKSEEPAAVDLLARFCTAASEAAQKLMRRAAVAPLIARPILGLLRHLTPGAGQPEEAEVLVSGLLRHWQDVQAAGGSSFQCYRLDPLVRERLLDTLPRAEILRTATEVAGLMESQFGCLQGWAAALRDPSSHAATIRIGDDPIAAAQAAILQRLGGRYAALLDTSEPPPVRIELGTWISHPFELATPWVERTELASLHAWWQDGGPDSGAVLFGPDGIGKSRLIAEFLREIGVDPRMTQAPLRTGRDLFYWSFAMDADPIAFVDALLAWLHPDSTVPEGDPLQLASDRLSEISASAGNHRLSADSHHLSARRPKSKPRVFLSYSRHDIDLLEELRTHVQDLEFQHGVASIWIDQELEPVANWEEWVSRDIDQATAAVVLVSPHFTESPYMRRELQHLFRRATQPDFALIPLFVRACQLPDDHPLLRFHSVNSPRRPLEALSRADRTVIWDTLKGRIERLTALPEASHPQVRAPVSLIVVDDLALLPEPGPGRTIAGGVHSLLRSIAEGAYPGVVTVATATGGKPWQWRAGVHQADGDVRTMRIHLDPLASEEGALFLSRLNVPGRHTDLLRVAKKCGNNPRDLALGAAYVHRIRRTGNPQIVAKRLAANVKGNAFESLLRIHLGELSVLDQRLGRCLWEFLAVSRIAWSEDELVTTLDSLPQVTPNRALTSGEWPEGGARRVREVLGEMRTQHLIINDGTGRFTVRPAVRRGLVSILSVAEMTSAYRRANAFLSARLQHRINRGRSSLVKG